MCESFEGFFVIEQKEGTIRQTYSWRKLSGIRVLLYHYLMLFQPIRKYLQRVLIVSLRLHNVFLHNYV